jgi:hypothetical protein
MHVIQWIAAQWSKRMLLALVFAASGALVALMLEGREAPVMEKQSYSGDATVFGHTYASDYAPLTDASGELTGGIFVATRK